MSDSRFLRLSLPAYILHGCENGLERDGLGEDDLVGIDLVAPRGFLAADQGCFVRHSDYYHRLLPTTWEGEAG